MSKLDLSKNNLKELPENFGDLIKLKHLDLYRNQIHHLPLSFSKLKALRWLDLKDNPLVPAIKEAAGMCLDTKQCHTCARDIVLFYSKLQEKVDKEREAREKQRQKNKEAHLLAVQRLKLEEKKNKKNIKKKAKNIEATVLMHEKINNLNKTERMLKKQKHNQIQLGSMFKFIFLFSCVLVTGLFVATAAKMKGTEIIEKKTIQLWHYYLNKFPSGMQHVGNNFGVLTNELFLLTRNIIQYTTKATKTGSFTYFFNRLHGILEFTIEKLHTFCDWYFR